MDTVILKEVLTHSYYLFLYFINFLLHLQVVVLMVMGIC